LHGIVIGGQNSYRTGWTLRGDTLDISSIWIDAGYQVLLVASGTDSLRGSFGEVGATSNRVRRPAVARRLGSCTQRIPATVLSPQLLGSPRDYGELTMRPPPGEPAWLVADSTIAAAPDGRRYVRNALLLLFSGGTAFTRHPVVQSLGGVVVGSLQPTVAASPMERTMILWVLEGTTLPDLLTVAERVRSHPLVSTVAPYYRTPR
jgi:hypothetical protein